MAVLIIYWMRDAKERVSLIVWHHSHFNLYSSMMMDGRNFLTHSHIHMYVYREYISSLNFKTNTFIHLLDSKKIGSRDILYMLHRLCSSAAKILTCACFTQWQIFQICKQIYPFFSTLHVYDPNFKSWCLTLCKLLTFQYW